MHAKDNNFDRLVAEAAAHFRSGQLSAAAAAYRAALQGQPQNTVVLHNLGVVVAQQNDPRTALPYFDAALALEPRYVSAHYNRAVALEALGDQKEAIAAFTRAAELDPGHYASHRALAFLLLAEGHRGRALDHFARTYDLRRGDDRSDIALKSLTNSNRTKLIHDAEQFRYLAGREREARGFKELSQAYETLARTFPEEVHPLSAADFELLGDTYNTPLHIADAPETAAGAVGPRPDREELTAQFKKDGAGAVYLDNLLTPRAFGILYRYLVESTIWHDFSHIAGFVAAYLEDGLACPLLLQIAHELQLAFPELLAEPLSQAWAFKGVVPNAAVDVHVDDAAVSVNFWMTPTEANLNPNGGGMRVCRAAPPPEWVIKDYEADKKSLVPFLEQNAKNTLVIPYRANRAVLFESRLIHTSDAPLFEESYEKHRVNITLLFGRARRL